MKALNGIQVRAVLIALFAFYVAPILPLIAVTSAPNFFGEPPAAGQRVPLWGSAGSFLLLWFWAWLRSDPVCSEVGCASPQSEATRWAASGIQLRH